MPNRDDFEGDITPSYHNEDPFSDYRAEKILSGVPRKTFSSGLFDRPTVEQNGVFYYDTQAFQGSVRNWVEDYSNDRDTGNMGGQRLRVDEANSTADFLRLIRTRENESDQQFDVRMDRQTGAMSVNNALSPSGGYFATASARMNKDSPDLEEHPFAIKNATENFRDALLDARGPVVGLQQRGGLYHNYDELSPQILASTKSSIYMPGKDLLGKNVEMRERIAMQDKLQDQVNLARADFARENNLEMRPALLRSKDGSNHLEDINETFSVYTPTDENGVSLFTDNSKRILMAKYEAFHKLSMDGEPMPQMQMAMNLTDATDAPIGYAERHRNRLLGIGLPEGAAEREAGSAQWARSSTYRVPLDRFDQLGLEVGQSFEGGTIPGLQPTEGSNYRRSYIQGIERDEGSGFVSITVNRTVDEVNSKFMGIKAFDHNVGPGGVPDGMDLVTRLGSEKDFAMRLTALYASDTATSGFEQGRSGVSVAQEHHVNYLVNNLGFDQDRAIDAFNMGNVEPTFRPYAFGAAMDYFKGRWFGERYNRTVGQDEVERYLAPGQKFSDFQFDDDGNVTNHPAMLRHDVSNPSEMVSVFGSRLVNDLTEAGSGQGLEKLRVTRRTEEGRYIVEARDVSLDSMSIMRNRAEFPSSSHVFGQDELNTMAAANPAIYQNLQDLDRRGVLKNYAREIVQAAQVNRGVDVNLGYGTPGGVINGLDMRDTSGNRITFGGIRDQVRAASPGYMDENEIAKRSLWELNRQTNGARIQLGDTLYGSAGAMATNFQLDDQGQSVNTLGTQFANVLDLQERFAGDLDNPNVAAEVANATIRLIEAQNLLSEQPAIRKAAGGIVSDVLGGPQVSNSGLALNEIAYNRADYLASLSGLTDDERTQRMADFDTGTAVSSFTMYPHSDSSNAFLNLRAVDADRVREREGMGDFYVRPGGNVVHPAVNQALNKDNDADFGMGIPFRREDTPTAHSEAEILARVRRSTGGEDVNALKVANRQVLNLFQGAVSHTVSPDGAVNSRYDAEVHGAALRNSQERKIMMGPNYNAGQREAMIFKREMLEQTNLSPQQKEALTQAAGKSASSPYQVELDMQGETDAATRFLLKARSNLSQPTLGVNGDRSLAGQASFFDVDNPEGGTNIPGFDHPLRMTELSGPQNFANFMISKMATQFMGRENYRERDPNHPESPTNTPGLVRDVAQNLLPVGVANDEGRIEAMSIFLGRIHAGYSQLSEEDQLNFRLNNDQLDEFLELAAPQSGKKGAQDYFFGNRHLAPEDRAMAPAVWNAYTARRAAYKKTYYGGQNEKGEDDAFSRPPKGDWELGSDTDAHGVERKWFRRNITDEGTIGDPQSFQGRGGEEGNRMAVLRGAYHDVAANQGSVEEQVADNRIVAANIAHATAHTSHMVNEGVLGAPETPLDALEAVNQAMAIFNAHSAMSQEINQAAALDPYQQNRRVYDPAIGHMTPRDLKPGRIAPEDDKDYTAYDNKDSAMDLLAETSSLPTDHPDRMAAVALFAEASEGMIGQARRPEAGGASGGGDDEPPFTETASEPEEPGRRPPAAPGISHTINNQNYTTVTQYRAQPPTIPEVEALRGQLSFLDSFQGMDDPAGLTHAQQGSLLGAVTAVQKLMARGESSIQNHQNDPGTRYYDQVMNGGEGTLKHDLLTTLDNLQPLVAAISPLHEETRLNIAYAKGNGVAGGLRESERHVAAMGPQIDSLIEALGIGSAEERGVARFQLEHYQRSVGQMTTEGRPMSPEMETRLDNVRESLQWAEDEGIRAVSPATIEARQARVAQRESIRQQREAARDDERLTARFAAYDQDRGGVEAAHEILSNVSLEDFNRIMTDAPTGDPTALKQAKAIQKQVATIQQYRDVSEAVPAHVAPFAAQLQGAIQAGDFAAANRPPEAKAAPPFEEGRASAVQNAVAGAAQNYIASNIDHVPDLLKRMNEAIAGTGQVSEEVTKKAQLFVRAFTDSADELDEAIRLKQNNGVLNARQQALMGDDSPDEAKARLNQQRETAAGLSGALYTLGAREESGEAMSSEERNARKWEAILAGGPSGQRKRDAAFGTGGVFDDGNEPPTLDMGLFGEVSGEGAIRAIGGAGRLAQAGARSLFQARMIANATISPVIERAEAYRQYVGESNRALFGSGRVDYNEALQGQFGDFARRDTNIALSELAMNRNANAMLSPLMNLANPNVAGGALGIGATIAQPALGIGAGAYLLGSPLIGAAAALPLGLAAAGAAAVGGTLLYAAGASQDSQMYARGANGSGYLGDQISFGVRNFTDSVHAFLDYSPEFQNERDQLRIQSALSAGGDEYFAGQSVEAIMNRDRQTLGLNQEELSVTDPSVMEGPASLRMVKRSPSDLIAAGMQNASTALQGRYGLADAKQAGEILSSILQQVGNHPFPALGSDELNNFVSAEASGVNYRETAQLIAQARGINPANSDALYPITTSVNARNVASGNQFQENAIQQYGASMVANTDYYRRLTGQQSVGTDFFNSPYFLSHPDQADQVRQSQEAFGAQALANNGFYKDVLQPVEGQNQMWAASVNGAPFAINQRKFLLESQGMYDQLTGNFVDGAAVGSMLDTMSGARFTDENRNQWRQLAQGNRYALSRAVQYGFVPNQGDTSLNTMNIQTGMGIFDTGGFSAQDFQQLAGNDPYGQFRISQEEFMRDGTRGLRNAQRVESYAFEDFSRIMGQRQQTLSYQLQTGQALAGRATFDGQGFMTNSGGQDVLQSLFAQYNLPGYQPTMSQYEIEDASTRLSREQQQYSQWQQGQGLQIDRASFALSGQQFAENFGLQQRQFQFQTNYQRNQMGFQREMQTTQEGWAREDLAYSRDQLQIHNAWAMDDYDRNIRYARGRDKRDLIRERGRQTIEYAMEMGQQDRQENRQETREDWSQQLFDKDKSYFEQNVAFQQEKMALQQKQFQEDRGLQEQRLKLSEQGHQKQMVWLVQQYALEDQQRVQTRQATEAQRAIQQDINAKTNDYVVRTRALGDAIQFADQRVSEWNSKIAVNAVNGTLAAIATAAFNAALSHVPANAQQAATAVQAIKTATGGVNTQPGRGHQSGGMAGGENVLNPYIGQSQNASQHFIASYQAGGFTGYAAQNQPVGVVHGGEYVVPSNGSLVLRDEDLITLMRKVVELLQRHGESLDKIASHPTQFIANINNSSSKPQDIYQQSRSWL